MDDRAGKTPAELHVLADEVEKAALADLHAAATADLAQRIGLRLQRIGGACVSVVARDPGIVLNRTAGLGIGTPASREDVRRVRAAYDDAGVGRHFVQVHPDAGPAELPAWLAEAGYEPRRSWMKFARGRQPAPRPETTLTVREIGSEHAADFGRIVAEGFDLSVLGGELVGALAVRPGWRLFMAFAGDAPAGTGGLFVRDGAAWLDWGATAREHRRKGAQSALLAHRVAAALEHGCDAMFTTTGEWVEGDPQHSYKNIRRAGFEELYLSRNYAPA